MLPRSTLSFFTLSSFFINANCRILSTANKINNRHLQDIDTLMAQMYHEDVLREIEDVHENLMDDMYDEETRYLEGNIIIESMYLEETRYLEDTSYNCISHLHNNHHNDDYFGHVSSQFIYISNKNFNMILLYQSSTHSRYRCDALHLLC